MVEGLDSGTVQYIPENFAVQSAVVRSGAAVGHLGVCVDNGYSYHAVVMTEGVLAEDGAGDHVVEPGMMPQMISPVGIQSSTKTFPNSVALHDMRLDCPPC